MLIFAGCAGFAGCVLSCDNSTFFIEVLITVIVCLIELLCAIYTCFNINKACLIRDCEFQNVIELDCNKIINIFK